MMDIENFLKNVKIRDLKKRITKSTRTEEVLFVSTETKKEKRKGKNKIILVEYGFLLNKKEGTLEYSGKTTYRKNPNTVNTVKGDGKKSSRPVGSYQTYYGYENIRDVYGITDADMEREKRFFGDKSDRSRFHEEIKEERSEKSAKRREEKRAEAYKEAMKGLREISDPMSDWLLDGMWEHKAVSIKGEDHAICTSCNKKIPLLKKRISTCPSCGKALKKCTVKYRYNMRKSQYAVIFQTAKDRVFVRFIKSSRYPYGDRFEYYGDERERFVITKDGILPWSSNNWSGEWSEGYGGGLMSSPFSGNGRVYMKNLHAACEKIKELRPETKYLPLEDMIKYLDGSTKRIGNLIQSLRMPSNEWLYKSGFYKLFKENLNDWSLNGLLVELGAKNLPDYLRIDRQTYRKLLPVKEDVTFGILSKARQFPKESAEAWKLMEKYPCDWESVLKCTTVHKAVRYLTENKQNPQTFSDYLAMSMEKGEMDRKNTAIVFPKHLVEEHDRLVEWHEAHEDEVKLLKLKKEAEAADKALERLGDSLNFTDEKMGLSVVTPKKGEEIINEGTNLHNCLKTSTYVKRISEGETNVVFIRKTTNLKKAFLAMEITNGKIVQALGFANTLPDESVLKFIKKYAAIKNLSVSNMNAYAIRVANMA